MSPILISSVSNKIIVELKYWEEVSYTCGMHAKGRESKQKCDSMLHLIICITENLVGAPKIYRKQSP